MLGLFCYINDMCLSTEFFPLSGQELRETPIIGRRLTFPDRTHYCFGSLEDWGRKGGAWLGGRGRSGGIFQAKFTGQALPGLRMESCGDAFPRRANGRQLLESQYK